MNLLSSLLACVTVLVPAVGFAEDGGFCRGINPNAPNCRRGSDRNSQSLERKIRDEKRLAKRIVNKAEDGKLQAWGIQGSTQFCSTYASSARLSAGKLVDAAVKARLVEARQATSSLVSFVAARIEEECD